MDNLCVSGVISPQSEISKNILIRYSPLSKLLVVLFFLICTASLPRYDLIGALFFLLFSLSFIFFANLKTITIFQRSLIVLPFVFFAGIANCILDHQQFSVSGFSIQGGILSFLVLLCKAFASVNIVFLFTACTTFQEISGAMFALHVPCICILQIQLMFRYLGVIIEEANMMRTAWHLRNPDAKHIPVTEWGQLVGHLFIRSVQRANAIYQSMQCRLFHAGIPLSTIRDTTPHEHFICAIFIAIFILARYFL